MQYFMHARQWWVVGCLQQDPFLIKRRLITQLHPDDMNASMIMIASMIMNASMIIADSWDGRD